MRTALQIVGLALEGDNHRALDDAINIARLLPFCPRPDSAADS
jgi:inhibitor of KinA sporulation pathway (predicted exonuclease)